MDVTTKQEKPMVGFSNMKSKKEYHAICQAFLELNIYQKMVLATAFKIVGNDRFDMRKERFITIGYCDIAADFGLPEDEEGAIQTFEKISKAIKDLFKRYFDFKVLNNQTGERTRLVAKVGWLTSFAVDEESMLVSISINPIIISMIGGKSKLTDFYNYIVSVFSEQGIEKIYTVKLCELIHLWNKQGLPFVVLDKEDLRAKLGIDRTLYSRNYDFRVHVLDKAINELQQTMGIMVNYEQIKKGKMVKQYRFLFNNDKKG